MELHELEGEELCEVLARSYHHGQTDKQGRPYIEHVERVARSPLLETTHQRQAAWLHDTIEDTDLEIDDLRNIGVERGVIRAVMALTHRKYEPRRQYIDRIKTNPIALAVKKADNRDNYARNADLPAGETRERLRVKYEREWEWLNEET